MENAKNAGSACFFVRFALISQPVSRLKGRLFVFINPPKFFAMKKLILIFLTVWSFGISFAAAAPSPKEEQGNTARWITADEGDVNARGAWIAFRKDVTLKRVPRSVELTIGADSKYWLWVNGELVLKLHPLGDILTFGASTVWVIYSILLPKLDSSSSALMTAAPCM